MNNLNLPTLRSACIAHRHLGVTLKFNFFLLVVSLGFSLLFFSACAPTKVAKSSGLLTENILGGIIGDTSFERNNGIVLIVITEEVPSQTPGTPPVKSQSICTGSLIAPTIVLTAAHCFARPNIKNAAIAFNVDVKNVTANDVIFATDFKINETFKPNNSKGTVFSEGFAWSDLALIKLEKAAPSNFQFAHLPTGNSQIISTSTKLILAGYGVTTPIVNKSIKDPVTGASKVAHLPSAGAGTLRFVDNVTILNVTPDNKEILIDQQNGAIGACHGDSGGPAYFKQDDGTFVLVGITSRGTNPLGNCDQSNVFTDVIGYLDWINANMGSM